MSKSNYQSGKDVLAVQESSNQKLNQSVTKSQVKPGRCPRKNYIIDEEDYVFFSGTVRPPFQRQFNMQGVT